MKATLTSALLLVFASFFLTPEPVTAASNATSVSTLTFNSCRATRRTKVVRSSKLPRSSAARAMARRNRRISF